MNLGLDVVNSVVGFHLEDDGLSSKGFTKTCMILAESPDFHGIASNGEHGKERMAVGGNDVSMRKQKI